MADNDQNNEEYEFSDLEGLNPEAADFEDEKSEFETTEAFGATKTTNVRRNALIVVGVFVFLMVLYKFVGSRFGESTKTAKTAVPPVQLTQPKPQPIPKPVAPSVLPTPPAATASSDKELKQKLSAMEISQQSLRSDLSSVSNQIGGINSNVSELSDQFNKINQMLEQLSQQLDQQSADIARLRRKMLPKKVKRPSRPVAQVITYNIQALIPGRAWLIASNGSTITVREGTSIRGYGIVKLIDPIQGKVITSSGKIIRFSQQDS